MTMVRYGSRKWIVALLSMASCTCLVMLGYIPAEVYKAVMISTAGAYIAGNVAQKWVEKSSAS